MRGEGVADPATTTRSLLNAAIEHGTRCLFGTRVTGVGAGWVATAQGRITADQVVIAAGTGSEALMEMAGHNLPMLDRPGVLVRTKPIARVSDYILVSPEGEARQEASGAMILPGAVSHQSDETESLAMTPDVAAEEAIARWRTNLKDGAQLEWSEASVAMRPVPKDGMPVIGAVEDGLYVASMHSGVTLAAITAQLSAAELTGEARNDTSLLAPFRPDRFTL
jgi:glycine/D-amino acid oxidase-like deaminating enzyme